MSRHSFTVFDQKHGKDSQLGHGDSEVHFTCMPVEEKLHLKCPSCGSDLLEVGSNYFKNLGQNRLFIDGGKINLPEFGKEDYGWAAYYFIGACPSCLIQHCMTKILTVCGAVDDDFQDKYFRENQDRGPFTNHIMVKAPSLWIVSQFDTDHGPMLEHHFGLFPHVEDCSSFLNPHRQFSQKIGCLNTLLFADTNPYFKRKVL